MNRDLIRQVPLFSQLPDAELDYLAQTLQYCERGPDTILFREGDLSQCFMVILDGQIEIVKALGTPEETVLTVEGPGEFLGEISLFLPDRNRSASARTLTHVQLFELSPAGFHTLLHRNPSLALPIMQVLTQRLRNSENTTIRDLQQKNIQLSEALQELHAAQEQLIEKEKLEHELQVARQIQERFLPKELPSKPGWEIAAYWQPARAVGGDFYDFVVFPNGQLGIVVGDVSGKGVPAALIMATTRSVMRAVTEHHFSPGSILERVNDLLNPDMPSNMFVTCVIAVLEPSSGHLRLANAGHDLPHHLALDGSLELHATGMPLGLLPGMRYDEIETTLSDGDSLLFYSDGLVEARDTQGEMYGFPRLRKFLSTWAQQKMASLTPDGASELLIRDLLESMQAFTGPTIEQDDDVTFVTLCRLQI